MNEASVHLPFKTIQNCRDLAGMKNPQQKFIRPGLLLRSAHLGRADQQDLLTLSRMGISDVIDFRTEGEVMLKPDHRIPGAAHHHVAVYREKDLKNEAGGQIELFKEVAFDSKKVLEDGYIGAIRNEDSIQAWKEFFSILLQAQGGVLFHCTQGKDRTGIAAMLIETALGIPRETILDDYLQTNLYTEDEAKEDRRMAAAVFEKHFQKARKDLDEDIDTFMYAHPECFEAVEKTIEEGWGSWQNYLTQALGLNERDFETLRRKYLEQR